MLRLDLATQEIGGIEASRQVDSEAPYLADLHDEVEMWAYGAGEVIVCCGPADQGGLILRSPGRDEQRYPAFIAPAGALSPDGRFLGGWTGDEDRARYGGISGAGFVDVASGEFFELPGGRAHGQGVSWTYGSTVMVETVSGGDGGPEQLYACDAARRTCDQIPTDGTVVLPR